LRQLLALAGAVETVVAMAVIPEEASPSLVAALAGAPCCVWQHGWRHRWESADEPAPYHAGEFGAGRPVEALMRDALAGQRAMDLRFGRTGWQRVFVPPFHALVVPLKRVLPSLGYTGVSAGDPHTPPIATVAEANADVDIIDWPNRRFLGGAAAAARVIDVLRARRAQGDGPSPPIGLLTHHLVMDDEAWRFIDGLLRVLREHPGAELLPADRVFAPAESGAPPGRGAVTVVVTSCGRQDLLERTLDSFLAHNTHPIHEFIVMEDGDGACNAALERKYAGRPFRWMATGERVGQVAAIDRAYAEVTTEYIFHCEDDWEFHAPGFIEPSKTLLDHNPSLLQVWLRGLADTNRHPVVGLTLTTCGVPYRLLRHHHDAGAWGVWHGFSWNPGLRRRRDYDRLGSFGALDPGGTAATWRVEAAAGAFYQAQGFFAAVLAGNGGGGYVRHLGGGRRVPRNAGDAAPATVPRRSSPRAQQAERLAARLSATGAFGRVPADCGNDAAAGVDEVPEWQVWTGRPTTPDQSRIEAALEELAEPGSRVLHIGVGNSSLGRRFAPRVARILGTTIHEPERAAAAALGLPNYTAVRANKYAADMDRLEGPFDFIVDNNPASFACCLHHFARMWVAYVELLAVPGGRLLTAQPGMRWVVTGNDPQWALGPADWEYLAGVLEMPMEHVGEEVYALACTPSSGAVWRGA
jgi:hypothetical protein